MWIVCAAEDTRIDLKALTKTLGCGSGNLRAGSEGDTLESVTMMRVKLGLLLSLMCCLSISTLNVVAGKLYSLWSDYDHVVLGDVSDSVSITEKTWVELQIVRLELSV